MRRRTLPRLSSCRRNRGSVSREADRLPQGAGEKESLLADKTDLLPQDLLRPEVDVDPIDEDGFFRNVVEPVKKAQKRALSAPRPSYDADHFSGPDVERDVFQIDFPLGESDRKK